MRRRIAVCFLALPWTSVVAGLLAGGNFVAAVAGGVVAALASATIAWRSGHGIEAAIAYAVGTAALSIATIVGTFFAWVAIECGDRGLDRC